MLAVAGGALHSGVCRAVVGCTVGGFQTWWVWEVVGCRGVVVVAAVVFRGV